MVDYGDYEFDDSIIDDFLGRSKGILADDNGHNHSYTLYNEYTDDDNNLYFEFALAGIDKKNIEITKKDGVITIKIHADKIENKFKYTWKGIKYPKPYEVTLATIDVSNEYVGDPEITYVDGLLKFKFTIKPEEKPRVLSF